MESMRFGLAASRATSCRNIRELVAGLMFVGIEGFRDDRI